MMTDTKDMTLEEVTGQIHICGEMTEYPVPEGLADGEYPVAAMLVDWAENAPTGDLPKQYRSTLTVKDGQFDPESLKKACAEMVKAASYHGRFIEGLAYNDPNAPEEELTDEEQAQLEADLQEDLQEENEATANGHIIPEYDDTILFEMFIGS